ncbi:CAP domain-containing protein, partial [Arthrospira platensis SPKY1]|nr:CAP domain-containing protein [Arthrospira platensis SPKY1]
KPEPALPAEESTILVDPSPFAAAMLAEVNALRQAGCRCGNRQMPPVPALSWSAPLARAAQRHADDMRRNHFFDHDGSDGSTMSSRATAAGYRWRSIAENIAWGYA